MSLLRPNKLRATIRRDDGSERRVFYDGRNLTIYDVGDKTFGTISAPPTLKEMLDFIVEQYEINVPFADFVHEDSFETLVTEIQEGIYVGTHLIDGKPTDHLAFRQAEVDWQIWVSRDAPPVPLKFLVTYKHEIGAPQFIVLFERWNFAPELPEEEFAFTAY